MTDKEEKSQLHTHTNKNKNKQKQTKSFKKQQKYTQVPIKRFLLEMFR